MVRVTGLALAAAALSLVGLSEASAQTARGSYRQSCTNISQNGPILEADCRDVRGNYRSSELDLRRCGGGAVANINGRLTCGGGGGGGGFGDGPGRGDGYGRGGYDRRDDDYGERRPSRGGEYDPYGRPPPRY